MANLPTKSFAVIVQTIAAGMQGRARAVLDFSIGSTLRAIAEAVAGVGLWMQGMILQLLLTTRARTSVDADLDSWMNDFGVLRLTASAATGMVTFARFTSTALGFIPVGAQVRTTDLSQTYQVVADGSNANFDPIQNGFVLPIGLSSITVPVKAMITSAAGNAAPNTLTIIASALTGIDTVTNVAALTNGADAESDESFRARFVLFIAALSKATPAAIIYAVRSLQLGLQATIMEGLNYDGTRHPGFFYVVVDDGTGNPPTATINAIGTAVEMVRPLGITYGVFPSTLVPASISISIASVAGYDHNVVVGLVFQAVQTYVNTLPLGAGLEYLKIGQIALQASRGVDKITSLSLNGQRDIDISVSPKKLIKISTLTVV